VGAFSLGQAAPSLQDFSVALGAAGFIYDVIDRVGVCVPYILSSNNTLQNMCKYTVLFRSLRLTLSLLED